TAFSAVCLSRRTHREQINGCFGALLATASSPRIDKRHFRQLTYHGDQYRCLSSVLTLFSFKYFSKKVNHWLLSSKNKSGNFCKEVYKNENNNHCYQCHSGRCSC